MKEVNSESDSSVQRKFDYTTKNMDRDMGSLVNASWRSASVP